MYLTRIQSNEPQSQPLILSRKAERPINPLSIWRRESGSRRARTPKWPQDSESEDTLMQRRRSLSGHKQPHSARKAFTGFTEAARCAGTILAIRAQIPNATIDAIKTNGSQLCTR
jgi:hypothetical protein